MREYCDGGRARSDPVEGPTSGDLGKREKRTARGSSDSGGAGKARGEAGEGVGGDDRGLTEGLEG